QVADIDQRWFDGGDHAGAAEWPEPATSIWQAATCESRSSHAPSSGDFTLHISSANGQRVWNRHPSGGSIGLGGSPVIGGSAIRLVGSIDGREPSNARVYGCSGRVKICAAGPSSTTRPRYITSTRLLIYRTTFRS